MFLHFMLWWFLYIYIQVFCPFCGGVRRLLFMRKVPLRSRVGGVGEVRSWECCVKRRRQKRLRLHSELLLCPSAKPQANRIPHPTPPPLPSPTRASRHRVTDTEPEPSIHLRFGGRWTREESALLLGQAVSLFLHSAVRPSVRLRVHSGVGSEIQPRTKECWSPGDERVETGPGVLLKPGQMPL